MSKALQDIEDELAADELDMCSSAAFSQKQVDNFVAFYSVGTALNFDNHQQPLARFVYVNILLFISYACVNILILIKFFTYYEDVIMSVGTVYRRLSRHHHHCQLSNDI